MRYLPGKLGASAVLLLTLAACQSLPTDGPAAITTFADGATLASKGIQAAFESANQAHYSAQGATYLANFNRNTNEPPVLADFLPANAIAARVDAFDRIADYAALLVDIAGNDKKSELGSASGALAASLQGFSSTATDANATAMATHIQGLGSMFVNGKRFAGIRDATREADPYIQQICALLIKDVDNLRSQLAIDNANVLFDNFKYLKNSLAAERQVGGAPITPLDASGRRHEVERLVDVIRQGKAADAVLLDLRQMAVDMGVAHHALADTYAESASALHKAQVFFNAAQHVRKLRSALTTPQG